MLVEFVTDQYPVSFKAELIPSFIREGMAIDCASLINVQKGRSVLHVNLNKVVQVPGMTIFLFPGDVVKVEDISDDFELDYVLFTEDILKEAAVGMEDMMFNMVRSYFYSDNPKLYEISESLISYARSLQADEGGIYSKQIMISLLRGMFLYANFFLVRNSFRVLPMEKKTDEIFGRFMYLLGQHFKETREASFYASKLSITPKHLTNIVKARTKMSVKEAIDEYVIMQIKLSLKTSPLPIKEISWDYNFSSPAFFSDYFKRHVGLTPAEYRQSWQFLYSNTNLFSRISKRGPFICP